MADSPDKAAKTKRVEIESEHQRFLEALATARTYGLDPGTAQRDLVEHVETGFKALLARADDEDSNVDDLVEDASNLANLRAYLLPVTEVALDAKAKVTEIRQWQVPPADLADIEDHYLRLILARVPQQAPGAAEPPPHVSREASAALLKIYEEYDYYDMYTDWYNDITAKAMAILFGLTTAVLAGAVTAISFKVIYPSVILAGVAGAGISVMNRLPAAAIVGAVYPFMLQAVARLVTGAASTVVGFALLSLGLINVTVAGTAISTLLDTASTETGFAARATVLGLGIVFGYSERALSTFSQSVLSRVSTDRDRKSRLPKG